VHGSGTRATDLVRLGVKLWTIPVKADNSTYPRCINEQQIYIILLLWID
jgi:hypothetical protein